MFIVLSLILLNNSPDVLTTFFYNVILVKIDFLILDFLNNDHLDICVYRRKLSKYFGYCCNLELVRKIT